MTKNILILFLFLSFISTSSAEEMTDDISPNREKLRVHCSRVMSILLTSPKPVSLHGSTPYPKVQRVYQSLTKDIYSTRLTVESLIESYERFLKNKSDRNKSDILGKLRVFQARELSKYIYLLKNEDDVDDLFQQINLFWLEALDKANYKSNMGPGSFLTSISYLDLIVERKTIDYVLKNHATRPGLKLASSPEWESVRIMRNIITNPLFTKESTDDVDTDTLLTLSDEALKIDNIEKELPDTARFISDNDISLTHKEIVDQIKNYIDTKYPKNVKNAEQARLNARARDIFYSRLLSENPLTLGELGLRHKTSGNRVRQVEQKNNSYDKKRVQNISNFPRIIFKSNIKRNSVDS